MTPAERTLNQLQEELRFAPELVGGRAVVLAQIERFFATHALTSADDLLVDSHRWAQLISEVTIPETSFFRHPESFAALVDGLAKSNVTSPRILCLPCSTGEEAYSIAIALREAGADSFAITALDASARCITHAERGVYGPRAVSRLAATGYESWISDGVIRNELRPFVTFQIANVFTFDPTPGSFDVIFCRNLLIYFDAANQRRLFERLEAWLRPGGTLFLGPGEATIASSHGWKNAGHSMSFSFVRSEPTQSPLPSRAPGKTCSDPPGATPVSAGPRPPKPPERPVPAEDIPSLAQATELADAGLLVAATAALARLHSRETPTAASLLLRGILQEAGGELPAAEQSYRQSLYLEPDELDALLHLARLLEADGRAERAAPLRRRIERLALPS